MLASVQVKFASRGRLQWTGTQDPALWQRVADYAMRSLHDRVTKQGIDGTGRRIPPLKQRATYYRTLGAEDARLAKEARKFGARSDRRVQTHVVPPGPPREREGSWSGYSKIHRMKIDGVWRDVRIMGGGYPELKRFLGAKPVRDGHLTGSMWASLTPQMRLFRGGVLLRLYFAGSDQKQKVSAGVTARGKTARRAIRQRDKAQWIQYSGQGRTGMRLFRLMTHTLEEIFRMRDMILAAGRLRAG